MGDFWVFGYGSLMWRPGFDALETRHARIRGLHRSLCIHSWVHRGTKERPGVVLGLDFGGSCHGMAFRIAGEKRDDVLAYLRAREMVTNVYREATRPVLIEDGRTVAATTYVVDRHHAQYAGHMDAETLAAQARGAVGQSGPNEEYVLQTVNQLRRMNIHDSRLEAVAALLGGC